MQWDKNAHALCHEFDLYLSAIVSSHGFSFHRSLDTLVLCNYDTLPTYFPTVPLCESGEDIGTARVGLMKQLHKKVE